MRSAVSRFVIPFPGAFAATGTVSAVCTAARAIPVSACTEWAESTRVMYWIAQQEFSTGRKQRRRGPWFEQRRSLFHEPTPGSLRPSTRPPRVLPGNWCGAGRAGPAPPGRAQAATPTTSADDALDGLVDLPGSSRL